MDKFRAQSIEDVIIIMDEIVRNYRIRGSRIAYFTVLYRTTTYLVKRYCDEGGFFDDDDRMREIDVCFANFYFDALFADQHYAEDPPSESWQLTFDAADDPNLVLIQHLLIGMNAHISLDLGIATAIVADGDLNDSLKRDFYRANNILASLIHLVQSEIASVSPLMNWFHHLSLHLENHLIDRSIRFARHRAWSFAERLTASPREDWARLIKEQDQEVANMSRAVISPGRLFQPALWLIRQQEKSAPHEIMSGLAGEKWYLNAHQKALDVIGEIDDPYSELMKRETHLMRAIQFFDNDD